MVTAAEEISRNLLPAPKGLQVHSGSCRICCGIDLHVGVDDPRVRRALERWRDELSDQRHPGDDGARRSAETPQRTCRVCGPDLLGSHSLTVRVTVDRQRHTHRDGYGLDVRADGIRLVGGSESGCFNGLQTLRQLARRFDGSLPCCTITDRPDFDTRGLLLDVTRGRVPKLETLKEFADRLASWKINQLQLNIEHAFVFSFDPEICDSDNGLTPDEVRSLDAYCRDRFIDLVPALATLGHMGRILSMPKYRSLAEVAPEETWEQMSWPKRVRGLTLDCLNPEAHALVERMWSDVLDAFSCETVNICGDEPWDMGTGGNRERFAQCGVGTAYVEHILRTRDICADRGRRAQFWSDVIRNHPDLVERLPPDATVLHWGYNDDTDYDGTALYVESGLETYVCPGTSGWKRIMNAVSTAERNIAAFAAAGKRLGATGLLNTDWGDHGHFNLPACSLHGIALGAALGWSADHPTGDDFDATFSRIVLLDHSGSCDDAQGTQDTQCMQDVQGIRLFREASRVSDTCETWRLLWSSLEDMRQDASLPSVEEAIRTRDAAERLGSWCKSADVGGPRSVAHSRDLTELSLAALFTELFAEKVLIARQAVGGSQSNIDTREARSAWADRVSEASALYAECWRARNKPSGLSDILRALSAAATNVRAVSSNPLPYGRVSEKRFPRGHE